MHADLRLAPTATKLPADAPGKVIVCGSHGGAYAGYLVARSGVRAFLLNDAGVGRDAAGIGALALAESMLIAAATIAHTSARIGDAADMWERGVLSHVNASAGAVGCVPGMSCKAAIERLAQAPVSSLDAPVYSEARHVLGRNGRGLEIVCVDSISLVNDADVGQIVASGSHGGLVAGQPGLAIRVKAAFALYNDAGIGRDEAGISRLPVLDEMGVAAATVGAASARIGDARSTLEDGLISRVNMLALAAGVELGMTARAAVEKFGSEHSA